jgi:hypothetical protein
MCDQPILLGSARDSGLANVAKRIGKTVAEKSGVLCKLRRATVILKLVQRSRPKVFAVAGVGTRTPQRMHGNQRSLKSSGLTVTLGFLHRLLLLISTIVSGLFALKPVARQGRNISEQWPIPLLLQSLLAATSV